MGLIVLEKDFVRINREKLARLWVISTEKLVAVIKGIYDKDKNKIKVETREADILMLELELGRENLVFFTVNFIHGLFWEIDLYGG